ncbi:BPTI/Kunitz domain-containing protein-like [Contarinia nasturtii]|uniref:BPTI/Kunitz domain-containing protein-like n=1 Tax=Contarinia nasturtii TaxID=265458 RepID=UPI0012D4ACEE|nr:BPTI/Kunitz domain-containing protein-like [Contarinia nasturtii]
MKFFEFFLAITFVVLVSSAEEKTREEICALSLEPKEIACKARILRWFHNSETGRCESFIYGGCLGNENNFDSKEECQEFCGVKEYCTLPKVIGYCKAIIPSYYYNSASDKCEYFQYGGCGGNENRFNTKEYCERNCKPYSAYL